MGSRIWQQTGDAASPRAKRLAQPVPTVIGMLCAAAAMAYGWAGVASSSGSMVVTAAAALATAGFVGAAVGVARRSSLLTGACLVVVGIAAPTGFAYIANLVALVCGVVLIAGGWRARRVDQHP